MNNLELDSLISDVVDKHLSTYYGIVNANGFVSADQLDDASCPGQMATLYKQFKKKDVTIVQSDTSKV